MKKGEKMPEWWRAKLRGPRPNTVGKLNHFWKGDDIGYGGIHCWMRNTFGTPDACEHCPRKGLSGRYIQWANKSGKYLRDRSDWIRLCTSCHKKYDFTEEARKRLSESHKGKTPWNKGLKGVQAYLPERNLKISRTLKLIGHKPSLFYIRGKDIKD